MHNNNKVVYRETNSIVTFYFKDETTYSIDFANINNGRYLYSYGILPENKLEVYDKNVWEHLLHEAGYVTKLYQGNKTHFKKRIYLPPTDIFGMYIDRRIYKDELVKFTYEQRYKDYSDNLPSIKILEKDLGFKDYSEFVFNREQELRSLLIKK